MPRHLRDLVTVSPPTFDRTDFARVDRQIAAPQGPLDRAWLMARFAEGLQIRILRDPRPGLVLFQPAPLAWRPIEGAERAIVVHDLRVAAGPGARAAARPLWDGVEDFARFYGFAAILALSGPEQGLIAPGLMPARGWMALDHGPGGARLLAQVLQGPMTLPRFPRDWRARAAALGPGVTIQTTGESTVLEARALCLAAKAAAAGVPVRRVRLSDPRAARQKAVSPGALFSVVRDGRRVAGPDSTDAEILDAITAEAALAPA